MEPIEDIRRAASSAADALDDLADAWAEYDADVPVIAAAIDTAKRNVMMACFRIGLYDQEQPHPDAAAARTPHRRND